MKIWILLNLSTFILSASSFGGSEDKFLKKYAMMKIYESCFGPEVVKQIRKDMKAACTKCAALETPPAEEPKPPSTGEQSESGPNQQKPNFDPEKLHQAILAYRPNTPPAPFYRPFGPAPGMAPYYNPLFSPAYQNPLLYQGYQFSPYGPSPLIGQQFYGNRMSRDMDLKEQLDQLTARKNGKVINVTCVMQELGYLDENLEPNYQKIGERINSLPVSGALKQDMQDGLTFCQQFSQCVPEVKKAKSPLSRELIKPMFFFKCYKHKKLEACIMKDVREKYTGVPDEEFDEDDEDALRRTGKQVKLSSSEEEINELASSMYQFLYGTDSDISIDGVL